MPVVIFAMIAGAPSARAQNLDQLGLIPAPSNANASALQQALVKANCYPLNTPDRFKTDSRFGRANPISFSRRALRNFFSARGVAPSSYANIGALLSAVQGSPGICPTATAGICRRDNIGTEYLQTRVGIDSVRSLSSSMSIALEFFDTAKKPTTPIFPTGGGDPVVLSPQNEDRITKYGIEGVTPDKTQKALETALYNFDNLVLAYALQQLPKCRKCGKINDWTYLRNVASKNFGYLIGRDPTVNANTPNAILFKRFHVDKIPEDLMDDVRPNIRVYRSITENLNNILASSQNLPLRLSELIDIRDEELFGIIEHFEANAPASKAVLMKTLAGSNQCFGFDGSKIYQ